MDNAQLQLQRREKDQFFKSHPQSPLTPDQQAKFSSLSYYDYNAELDITATIEPIADGRFVQIQTTTGDVRQFKRYGTFTFTVDGQEASLTIYEADYGFFLPFVDAGAGTETYPAGRYLEPEYLGDNRFMLTSTTPTILTVRIRMVGAARLRPQKIASRCLCGQVRSCQSVIGWRNYRPLYPTR